MFEQFLVPGIILSLLAIAAGYLLPLGQYKLPLQLFGTVLVAALLFVAGQHAERTSWESKMNKANLEIAELKVRAEKINTQVVIEYRDKIQYIDKIRTQKVTEYVTVVDDSKCVVNNGFVELFNSSALGKVDDAPEANSGEASKTKLSDIAEVTKDNNAEYHTIKARLESLQDWVTLQKQNWDTK